MKAFLKKIIPSKLRKVNRQYIIEPLLIRRSIKRNQSIINELMAKDRIKVVFFIPFSLSWKYHTIYTKMEAMEIFEPIVVIIPVIGSGEIFMMNEMSKAETFCKKMNYRFVNTWDEKEGEFIDIKRNIKPDIVFFSHPYYLTDKKYMLKNFLDTIVCYVPYSIRQETTYKLKFDTLFHNMIWRNYYESPIHLEIAKKYARNKGANVIPTGYPLLNEIHETRADDEKIWKMQDRKKKKIIWAPHWTIKGHQDTTLDWSSFLLFYDLMFNLAEEYKDLLQFSFKPHGLLKKTLEQDGLWGKQKTDEYYERWTQTSNGQVNESDYIDLFVTSDALIHDCGSFMIEYLVLNKPILYLLNGDDINKRFNQFGDLAFDCHYKAACEKDIRRFLDDVVLGGKDDLESKRISFQKDILMLNGKTAAEKIIDDILLNLGKL